MKLKQATNLGAIMSLFCITTMAVLFLSETYAFTQTSLITNIAMDDNPEAQIRLNFNITMLDLHCDFVSVDVLDSLGTNRQNITKNIEKWQIDGDGMRRVFSGRNREVRELAHEEHEETLEQLHSNGVHAIPLTKDTFENFVSENDAVFVNFFAPWCVWCQRLHPTWEKFAEQMESERVDIRVATIDCIAEMDLCRKVGIRAFPSLRWYEDGSHVQPDYKQDRTVSALAGFTKRKRDMSQKHRSMLADGKVRGIKS